MTLCSDCNLRPRIQTYRCSYCAECKNARWRQHYDKNPEERYGRTVNWRQKNPKALQAQSNRYQEKLTPEQRRLKYENALQAHLRSNMKRRAKLVNAFVEHVEPIILIELDDGVCGICHEDVDPFNFHIDHIIPLALGGEHSYANTQVAHPSCNIRKGARCEL